MARNIDVPGVALITGAASGIGRATAVAFAEAGCTRLVLLDLNSAGLETTRTLLLEKFNHTTIPGGSVKPLEIGFYQVDVSSAESVTAAFAAAKDKFSRIDYSVHCAGILVFSGGSADCPIESFDHQTSVIYRGLWLCSREAIKIMRSQPLDSEAYPDALIPAHRAQRGAIVNISSGLALYTMPGSPAYSGAKAAILAITRSDAVDYATDRIRVNAVLPGVVDSPMTNPSAEVRAWLEANAVPRHPMNRFGHPEEVADVCLLLAGNKASYVTGASWSVDGGWAAGR
ncbi:hypothetical protein PV08_05782 [Exophiala spinifera]|uniref:Uncharacterized protein n=1 Tax=Exophiala spinifera TaxID=91928 RepID=A0A0D1ZSC9_9EURO|nr:uncharacterized protein PV08_05782 [Exophiala spinifera]KIW15732.1 hypothetical protein PV08_05782 [Exophiala spinifera]